MLKFYKCAHCGNIAMKVYDCGVPLDCCGERMEEMVANTVDAAVEKHVPVVERDGDVLKVTVGSVMHPMTEEHLVAFVVLELEGGYRVAELTADDEPVVTFTLGATDAPKAVYEYCNLHGLWKAEL